MLSLLFKAVQAAGFFLAVACPCGCCNP